MQFIPDEQQSEVAQIPKINFVPDEPININTGDSSIPEFIEEIGQRWEGRGEAMAEDLREYEAGELDSDTGIDFIDKSIGRANFELQTTGKLVGAGWDALGSVVGAGVDQLGKGISLVMPDDMEDSIKKKVSDSWDWTLNTEGGQLAQQALEGTYEMWQEYAKNNPVGADNIRAIANIGLIFGPKYKGKGSKVSPVPSFDKRRKVLLTGDTKIPFKKDPINLNIPKTTIPSITDAQRNRKSVIKEKEQRKLEDLVLPGMDAAKAQRSTQRGPFKETVVTLNQGEKNILNEVRKVKGVSASKSAQTNLGLLKEETNKLGSNLDKRLKNSNILIPPTTVNKTIDDAINALLNPQTGNIYLKNNKQIAAMMQDFATQAKEIFSRFPSTPSGLLAARKEFDNKVREQLGDKAFDANNITAMNEAMRVIRSSVNGLINTNVPSAFVQKNLTRQSRLFSARDVLAVKAKDEAKKWSGRLFQNISRFAGLNMNLRRNLAIIAGTSVFAVSGGLMAGAAGALSLFAVGNMAVRGTMSPKVHSAFLGLLKETNKAIQKTTSLEGLQALRADRALLIEFLKSMKVEEEE